MKELAVDEDIVVEPYLTVVDLLLMVLLYAPLAVRVTFVADFPWTYFPAYPGDGLCAIETEGLTLEGTVAVKLTVFDPIRVVPL